MSKLGERGEEKKRKENERTDHFHSGPDPRRLQPSRNFVLGESFLVDLRGGTDLNFYFGLYSNVLRYDSKKMEVQSDSSNYPSRTQKMERLGKKFGIRNRLIFFPACNVTRFG
jgi:hypothetical protein